MAAGLQPSATSNACSSKGRFAFTSKWVGLNGVDSYSGILFCLEMERNIDTFYDMEYDVSKLILLVGRNPSKQTHGGRGWGRGLGVARAEEEGDGELVLTRAFQMGTTKEFWREAVGTVCPV